MVEQDPRDGVEAVALAVVHGDPVAVGLGDGVGAARVERRRFVLRRFPRLAEHLGAGGLVEADLGIHEADRIQHARDADRRELPGQRRLHPAGRHERLRRQVVELGRPRRAQRSHQRALVEQVGLVQHHAPAQMRDALEGLGARAPHEAVDLVALLEQELGQVGAVLAGDAGDQRAALPQRSSSFVPTTHSPPAPSSLARIERAPRFQSRRSVSTITTARKSAATTPRIRVKESAIRQKQAVTK